MTGMTPVKSKISSCLAAIALAAGLSVAQAQEATLDVTVEGDVEIGCALSGVYFQFASASGAPEDINDGETGFTILEFSDFNDQDVGRFTILCNSGTATVTVDTINNFQLELAGSADAIPFTLLIPEVPELAGGFTASSAFTADTIPGDSVERTLLVNLGPISAIDFEPGAYSDVIRISVVPNA